MSLSPIFMRSALLICIVAMDLLAAFYLQKRKMAPLAYLGWGLFALILPLIGSFLVISTQPGQKRNSQR